MASLLSMMSIGTSTQTNEPTTWTQRTSSYTGSDYIYNAIYTGAYWVTCGAFDKMSTCTDPTSTWTQGNANFSGSNVYGMGYGNGWIILVGSGSKLTTDQTPFNSYSVQTHPLGGNLKDVASDGTTYCAMADGGIETATDPNGTWTLGATGSNLRAVSYGNSLWINVGLSGFLRTATDPTSTWTTRTSSFGTSGILDVQYGDGNWVAVGSSGKIAVSTDGITWTQQTALSQDLVGVMYGNGVWVAVGKSGLLATAVSPTGTWTVQTSSFGTTEIQGIGYGNGYWVAVGSEGKLATAV